MTDIVVPPAPAGLPPTPELAAALVAESGLMTPFLLQELPLTAEDRTAIRSLAAKVTQDEGRWLISTFLAFFEHGRRDKLGSLGIPALVDRAGYQVG